MPFYDYRCTNQDCQRETEVLHSMTGSDPVGCPECGYLMKKLLSPVPHKFQQKRGTMGVIHGKNPSKREDLT